MTPDTVYERLGGSAGVRALVERFYALMDTLPEVAHLRALHPQDLAGSTDSLYKFLSGWFGGPPLYMRERGHPRLRMRHAPFRVGPTERDAWMLCMRKALVEQVPEVALRASVEQAFAGMADHMINAAERPA